MLKFDNMCSIYYRFVFDHCYKVYPLYQSYVMPIYVCITQHITHNKIYKLEQLMPHNHVQNCYMCQENVNDFVTLVSHSLYGKYSSSQNFYYTKQVNEILEEAISPAYIQFQDNNFYDNDQQFLKREYKEEQFPKKIQMLSQYYKFHRDLPVWNERHVEGIMNKYYNRLKDVDYKKIKSVLKKQQGISLTTHKSFSSFDDSDHTKRSRYSTMLNDLEQSNDSQVLREMCQKIGKALKKVKLENNFKGSYYSGQKKFEQYIKKQKKRKQVNRNEQQNNRQGLGFRKIKYNPKLATKNDEVGLKQIVFVSNHSIKQRKYFGTKIATSAQKTTFNQTVSREQKIKRQKSKQKIVTSSSSQQLTRKKSTFRNPIIDDIIGSSLRPIKGSRIISLLHNDNLKTINQIYKPAQKNEKREKTSANGQLGRKSSSKQLVSRLKLRSNSQHNLPTSATLRKDSSKNKLLSSVKIGRSPRKYTISIAGKCQIELENQRQEVLKPQTARESTNRILRVNSSGKLSTQNQKQYRTNKVSDRAQTKRKSAIEEILQKKLNIFKRKQPVY